MNRKLMLQYLDKLAQLECQAYTLERMQKQLEQNIARLGHPQKFRKPKKPEKEKLTAKDIGLSILATVVFFIPVWFALFFVITVLVSCIGTEVYGDFDKAPEYIQELSGWLMVCLPAILAPIGIFTVTLYRTADEIKSEKKRYQKELSVYQPAVAADKLRVQQELEVKAALCAQRDDIQREHDATVAARNALYALNIIHRDYRTFVAVATFYDYFDKGICFEFEGTFGANSRYRDDLKHKQIIDRLDIIINKLDEIAKNQAFLADLLRDSNNTLYRIERGNQQMLDSMQRMEENTELTAYNTECAARSSEVTALLSLYNTLKPKDNE